MKTHQGELLQDHELWLNKAVGFVTRARQEMWGKHNAEIMAFLFSYGISNKTIEDFIFGWNRRGKSRSAESWGFAPEQGKLLFPEGIVVPYIVEKELKKITIVRHNDDTENNKNVFIQGSQPLSMIFDENPKNSLTYVIENVLDAFYLLQELKLKEKAEEVCLIIPHDLSSPPDEPAERKLEKSEKIIFLTNKTDNSSELWAKKFNNSDIHTYQNREELGRL